jgi:hypothetical protein
MNVVFKIVTIILNVTVVVVVVLWSRHSVFSHLTPLTGLSRCLSQLPPITPMQ